MHSHTAYILDIFTYTFVYIFIFYYSAVKRLIVINRIQNIRFCLHNIYVCVVCVYIDTLTYSIYFVNIYMHIYSYYYILYK